MHHPFHLIRIVVHPLSPTRVKVEMMSKFDPKIAFLPKSIVNFAIKQIIHLNYKVPLFLFFFKRNLALNFIIVIFLFYGNNLLLLNRKSSRYYVLKNLKLQLQQRKDLLPIDRESEIILLTMKKNCNSSLK